ncbi:MAG: hypothetical protein M3Y56_05085 [Armatimonadota bacterium]|nr:hypothetical protein [Armatimonadota bacterium]
MEMKEEPLQHLVVAVPPDDVRPLRFLNEASDYTGGYVQSTPSHAHLPLLVGSDGAPVYLYNFVEAIDAVIEYDRIREEFPTLSYSQISSALAFLRRIAQVNTAGVDIDEIINQIECKDPEFLNKLDGALEDKESCCVLDFNQQDSSPGL